MRRGFISATVFLALGLAPCAASADVTVVTATIYGGSSGGSKHASASQGQLVSACSAYAGPNPLSLFGPHGAYAGQQQLSATSTWDLATILSCGLQQTLSAVDSVIVLNPASGYERPLSAQQLGDPSGYQDPAGAGALPVVSNDGGENLNTYVRPWRGGHDDNESDWIASGPGAIALIVYENGTPPLSATIIAQPAAQTSRGVRYSFAARVTDRAGRPVTASQLSWSWSFGDASPEASSPYPAHAFAPGRYPVTLQVTDAARGTGATATLELSVGDSSASGTSPQTGSGATGPTGGPANGRQSTPSGGSGTGGAPSSGGATSASPTGNSAPQWSTTTTSKIVQTITVTKPAVPKPPAVAHRGPHRAGRSRSTAKRTNSGQNSRALALPVPAGIPTPQTFRIPVGPMISGQLISFTRSVPAAASPARAAASPTSQPVPIRRAVAGSPLVAACSVMLALLVLSLGAVQELRLRPRRVAIVLRPVS